VIYGADDYDYAGEAVSCGDINGDGYDDVILGSHQGNGPGNGRDNAGEVWVVYGSGSPLTSIDLAVPPANTTVIFGADINDRAGSSVSSGDINGDGFEEVVLGAYWADGPLDATLSAGEIWIIYGSASPSSAIDLATPPSNARVIYGADSGDQAGDAIDLPGDINGDGYRDVIVGIGNGNGPDNGRSSSGEISVVFGEPFFRYSLRSETYTWIDATVGNDLGMTCDNCCMPVSIGFTFEFYGRTYDTLYVCDDGYLSFSPVSAPGPWNACFPDRHTPNNIIAPLWDDLNPESGGAVYSFLEGTAPNRRLTLEWSGIPHYPAVGDATFEVTLFEGINQILVQYQDTVFGSGSDSGATATAGLENITGINGQALSCYSSDLKDETAWRAVPFGAYRLYSDDMENGPNGWSGFGLWHQENSACDPYYRSPSTSWYYGQTATCTYNTGATNSNNLNVPTQSYDYYSHMDWWFRRETEGGSTTTDQSLVRLSEDAGPYNVVDQITVNDNLWHSWKTDLSSSSGSDIYMRFTFDTVDSLFNDYLGWMVDDVEIWGCDVHGSKVVLNTLAYARPAPVCETSGYLLDGSGSFAGGCGAPITYQWFEDGSAITGAASLQYTIPASHDIGTFAYILEATCPSPSLVDQSDPVSVTVVTMPGEVPETSFMLVKTAEEGIAMTWVNVAGGDLYTVYRDLDASGTFDGAVNTGHDGSTGLTIDVPGEDLVFYLVSAGNDTCGEGPKR